MLVVFFYCYGDHRDLHVLTHSFPTRRSSDLCNVAKKGIQRLIEGPQYRATCADQRSIGALHDGHRQHQRSIVARAVSDLGGEFMPTQCTGIGKMPYAGCAIQQEIERCMAEIRDKRW